MLIVTLYYAIMTNMLVNGKYEIVYSFFNNGQEYLILKKSKNFKN